VSPLPHCLALLRPPADSFFPPSSPDDTFEIKINDESVKTGSLADSFAPAVYPPATVADPSSTKPADWVDEAEIADPEATKPADWDESAPALITDDEAVMPEGWLVDEQPTIADPEAVIPDEWDEEEDGDWLAPSVPNPLCEDAPGCGPWTAPLVPNPAYRGMWSAPRVPNPAYSGIWQPDQMPNPAFFEPGPIATGLDDIRSVGLELWTMTDDMLCASLSLVSRLSTPAQQCLPFPTSAPAVDNIYIGHSPSDAASLAAETFHPKLALEQVVEKAALEDEEEEDAAHAKKLAGAKGFVGQAIDSVKGRFVETVECVPPRPLARPTGCRETDVLCCSLAPLAGRPRTLSSFSRRTGGRRFRRTRPSSRPSPPRSSPSSPSSPPSVILPALLLALL
jgi:hypothetical protein